MPGISRSSRTTSTLVERSTISACSAVPACATMARSASRSIIRENTVRTVSESSITITRTLQGAGFCKEVTPKPGRTRSVRSTAAIAKALSQAMPTSWSLI